MRPYRIRNLFRTPGGFAKVFPIIIIIMAIVAVLGANKTPAAADNSSSQPQLSEIAFGGTMHGNLDETDIRLRSGQSCDKYTFEGIGGQEIIISLSTLEFDSFLWLLNPKGKVIAIDDDNGDGMGSIISNFALPETGQYIIWASTHGAEGSGAYTLTLNEAPSIDSPRTISIGDKVKGNLNGSSPQFSTGQFYEAYTFEASHSEVISIVMDSNRIDTYLWLLDKEGRVIMVNDNARSKQKGRSQLIFLPLASDTYTVLASSSAPMEKGKYFLSLDKSPIPAKAENIFDTVQGNLEAADFQLNAGQYLDIYAFSAEMGESITLELSSPDIDSYLRILDHRGNVIKADNNSGFKVDALIYNFSLPETGKYYAWVSSVFAGEKGEYVLYFNKGASLSQQKSLPEPGIGIGEGINLIYGKKRRCGCPGGGDPGDDLGAIMGAGQSMTNPNRCKDSTTVYSAYVDVEGLASGSVNFTDLSPTIVISPLSKAFSGGPGTVTVSVFSITLSSAPVGTYAITATVPGLGSDSENLYVVEKIINPTGDITVGNTVTFTVNPQAPSPFDGFNWAVVGGDPNGTFNPTTGYTTVFTTVSTGTKTIKLTGHGLTESDCNFTVTVVN